MLEVLGALTALGRYPGGPGMMEDKGCKQIGACLNCESKIKKHKKIK